MNTSYLKEFYAFAENKASLILLNRNQLKDNLVEITKNFILKDGFTGLIISYSYPSEHFLSEPLIQQVPKEKILFMDLSSDKKGHETIDGFQVTNIDNPANLTKLEMYLEKFLNDGSNPKFVIFESISALSVYVDEKVLQKFIYYLNNKVIISGGTLIVLTVKESTSEKTLSLAKQFSEKTYDFSEIYTSEVQNLI
jgi:hypothetical protein